MSEVVQRVMDAIMAATPGYIYEPVKIEAAARGAIEALRYVDGTDEEIALQVSKHEAVDPVICIDIHDKWIDEALR